jgi:hypothetical protein
VRKLLAPVAALGLVLAMAGTVLAWVQPTLTSDCAPDANHFAWKINLHNEQNFSIDWSFASNFSGATAIDFGSAGDHSFVTPRGGSTLYVRWTSDHNSKAQANANLDLCAKQSESEKESAKESAEQSVKGTTGIPNTSGSGSGSNPIPTIVFSAVLLASLTALAYGNVKMAKGTRPIR